MKRFVLPVLVAAFFAITAAAQEKFTLKLKKDAQGDVTKAVEKDNEAGKMSFSFMGQAQAKDEDKTRVQRSSKKKSLKRLRARRRPN